jgi:lysophospholipase L1-like esterase
MSRRLMRIGPALVLVVVLAVSAAAEFPLQEGDLVVMAGDSITAQQLHSAYIESYCVARFPKWNLRFRNSGVGGDRVPSVLARFDPDVASWKPTVVTVELGMNDSGGGLNAVDPYLQQFGQLIDRIGAIGARPVLLTASPVNDGTRANALQGRNITLDAMATRLAELAAKQGIPCADQFHALLDLWGLNKAEGEPVPLMGDGVHPGPPGQLTMAWACLVGLGAPAEVSSAAIDAAGGKVTAASGCEVADLQVADRRVTFTRLDACLPWPIPANARPGLKLVPALEQLDRYMLQVTGLPAGRYAVRIDGVDVADVSADELAAGYNMAAAETGPIADQLNQINDLIGKKAALVGERRGVAKFQAPQWLGDLLEPVGKRQAEAVAAIDAQLADWDAQISAACQPKPRRFEIAPK